MFSVIREDNVSFSNLMYLILSVISFPPVVFVEGGLGMHIKEGPRLQQSYSYFLPLED